MKCTVDGLEIYYNSKGEGFPLLMIHGYSLDHRAMTGCMEPLFAQQPGFQRIYLDLPGMGRTAASEDLRTSDDMLQLLIAFIRQMLDTRPFALVGYSYGGYLARGIAHELKSQVEGMLLICPVVKFLRSKRRCPSPVVLKKDKALFEELPMLDASDFQSVAVLQTRSVWERFQKEILPGLRRADFSLLERLRDSEFSLDIDTWASSFVKPVSLILAHYDHTVGYLDGIDLYRKYPDASLIVADHSGHLVQIEQPYLFNTAVNQWLKRMANIPPVSDTREFP